MIFPFAESREQMTDEIDFLPDPEAGEAPAIGRSDWLLAGFLLYFCAVSLIILLFLLLAWNNA